MNEYTTQGGIYPTYYNVLTQGGHVLVAGATGSGKSVFINNIIKYIIATAPPSNSAFVFIDSKRVELQEYQKTPHCLIYADTPTKILQAIRRVNAEMSKRFKTMKSAKLKQYNGTNLFIIIDELADIYINHKSTALLLDNIATLGRAASITIIGGTQRPTRDIIRPLVSVNFIHKVALHTNSKRDSINIIGTAGAEALPMYGYGIIQTPSHDLQIIKIDRL